MLIGFEFRLRARLSDLGVLAIRGANQVLHMDLSGIGCREVSRVQDNVTNVSASQRKALGKIADVHVLRHRRGLRETLLPDLISQRCVWKRELDGEMHPAEKTLVDVADEI